MSNVSVTYTPTNGTTADATQVVTNFSDITTYINNRNNGTAWDAVKGLSSSNIPGIFDNSTGTQNILEARDNGTAVFAVADGGACTIGGNVTATSATLVPAILNNSSGTQDIFQAKDNGSTVFSVADGGAVTVTGSLTVNGTTLGSSPFRNRIINGNMRIDQRNAGAAVTISSTSKAYPVDRWYGQGQNADGVFTLQQDTTAPTGFLTSVKAVVTTADASIGSSQTYVLIQSIEGTFCDDFFLGTASAASLSLSFYVRSTLTGTFSGALQNSAADRSYPFSYAINSANTWERKTVTLTGDTTGTWLTTTGIGVKLIFDLGSGTSVRGTAATWAGANYVGVTGAASVIGTLNANIYFSGVQLEVGSSATSFEYRPFVEEIKLCQRYYAKTFPYATAPAQNAGTLGAHSCCLSAAGGSTGVHLGTWRFPVALRATPTATLYNPSATNAQARNLDSSGDFSNTVSTNESSEGLAVRGDAVGSVGQSVMVHIAATAEY